MNKEREDNYEFESEELSIEEDEWEETDNYLKADVAFQSETVTKDGLKPWDEIKASKELWEGSYVTLDHPENLILEDSNDVIGRLINVSENEDKKRLEGELRVYKNLPSHNSEHTEEEWNEIVDEVRDRDKVSVGYYFVPEGESGTYEGENGGPLEYEFIKRDFLPNHTAIVEENPACSPEQGCGINIECEDEIEDVNDIATEASTPTYEGTEDKDWSEVDKTFTGFKRALDIDQDKSWEDLTEEEKDKIRKHFIRQSGDTFGSLGYPVVNPNTNKLNRNAVANAKSYASSEGHSAVEEVANKLWDKEFSDQEVENMDMEKITKKLKEIEKLIRNEDSMTENDTGPEDCTEGKMEDDRASDRLEEVEAELEKLRKEKEELEEQLDDYRETEKERLVTEADELTDLSETELEEKSVCDLKNIIEGAESAASVEEAGPNLNSAPGREEEEEEREVKDLYWKNQEGE